MFRLVRNLTVLAAAIGLVTVAAAVWLFFSGSVSARQTPGRLETLAARQVRRLAIPRRVQTLTSPLPTSAENLRDGLRHFADHCAACHANDGSGDTSWGRNLYPKPPDLSLDATQRLSDGELFYVIGNGIRFTGMPAFGDGSEASASDSWKLVQFIRHLPSLSPDELAEMQRLNPRSPDEFRQEEEIRRFLEGEIPQTPAANRPPHTYGGSNAQRNQ